MAGNIYTQARGRGQKAQKAKRKEIHLILNAASANGRKNLETVSMR